MYDTSNRIRIPRGIHFCSYFKDLKGSSTVKIPPKSTEYQVVLQYKAFMIREHIDLCMYSLPDPCMLHDFFCLDNKKNLEILICNKSCTYHLLWGSVKNSSFAIRVLKPSLWQTTLINRLLHLRGHPSFSSFTLMIISIIRGWRGLKNDDKYHNYRKGRGVSEL